MKNEIRLLNLVCVAAALLFLGLALINALTSRQFFTTDNLFITAVCLVMALMFAVGPVLHLKSQGRLPLPFQKRIAAQQRSNLAPSAPPLLDAKGREVPPDVRAMVANMRQAQPKDR